MSKPAVLQLDCTDESGVDEIQLTEVQSARIAWLLKIPDDEPIFTLRGQDRLAPELVQEWSNRLYLLGDPCNPKVGDAHAIADQMRRWPHRKIPD